MSKPIAFDTETTGLRVWHGESPFAISACDTEGESYCVEFPVDPFTRRVLYDRLPRKAEKDFERLRGWLLDPTIPKVFHNAKFDVRMLDMGCGIKVAGRVEENMFAAHTCNTHEPSFKLKDLSVKYLGISRDDQKELQAATVRARNAGKKLGWALADSVEADYWMVKALDPASDVCRRYAILDAERTMLLWLMYEKGMEKYQTRGTYDAEMDLWPVTYAMETRGVRLDREIAQREFDRNLEEAQRHEEELYELAGCRFDVNSHAQLGKIFFQKMGMEVRVRTKTGEPAVNFKALEEYKDTAIVRTLLQYRSATKAHSSFFGNYLKEAVPDPLNPGGWVLHANFNQVGPVTGRFSCRNPNLQNAANAAGTRSEEPIQAREPFGPRPGYVWYHYDFSQLEVRIFAACSKEDSLLDAILHGRDLHTECANKAWGGRGNPAAVREAIHVLELSQAAPSSPEVAEFWTNEDDPAEVACDWLDRFDWNIVAAESSLKKKNTRNKAKLILFSKLFGGGANAVKDLLHVSKVEAKQFLRDYDAAFPKIVGYIHELSDQAAADGFVRTAYDRRIEVDPDSAYRAVNYKVQGSAADFMKRGMYRVGKYLRNVGLDAHIVMTIHDELVFEVRKEHAFKWLLEAVKGLMEDHEGHFDIAMPTEITRVTNTWVKKKVVKL